MGLVQRRNSDVSVADLELRFSRIFVLPLNHREVNGANEVGTTGTALAANKNGVLRRVQHRN